MFSFSFVKAAALHSMKLAAPCSTRDAICCALPMNWNAASSASPMAGRPNCASRLTPSFRSNASIRCSSAFYGAGHSTQIRLFYEVLGGTWDALATGRADLAIGAPGDMPARSGMATRPLCTRSDFVFAIAPSHPLAAWQGVIPNSELARHRAIVIADTSQELVARSIGLIEGQEALRVPDIRAKASAQVAGLGIGHLPRWLAAPEIAAGRLVEMQISEPRPELPLNLAWKTRNSGKALKWFLDELEKTEQIEALTAAL
jgi:DNA-binding transcriptional LysR family regulator